MDSIKGLQVMTLANSIIGVSILAMPYCFKQCGIILSIVLLLFSSILSRLSCHFLIKSAIKSKLKTFENLAFCAFGPLGKFAVEIGLIGFLIGTCIAFFVVMGDLGPQIVAQLSETHATSQLRTLILVLLAMFCVLPLGLLRNIESLSGVCTATIGFYACLVLKIMFESAPHIASGDWVANVDFWNPSGILQCIPIFSMALFCQTQLFEIYQTMPNASLDKMNAVVRIATHICTCVYVFVGVFGYIAVSGQGAPFGGNILLSFRPSIITEIIKIGFVLSVAFSFPLVIFPCRASIYSLLYKSSYNLLDSNSINNMSSNSNHTSASTIYIPENKFRSITILIVITSLLIGIIIPNIELVLGLVGSTIGVMVCVIFPATSFICLTTKNTNERIGAQIMLCIGILVMILGSYANLYAIEEVALNPIEAVKPIQIENIPVKESAINSLNEKHIIESPKLDLETILQDTKLKEINNNIPKDEVKVKPVVIIDEIDKILEPKKEKVKDNLSEIRHEPVQPEEPIEEPKKDEVKIEVKEPDNAKVKNKDIEKVAQNKSIEKIETAVVAEEGKVVKPDANIDVEALRKEDAEELEQKKKEIIQESQKNKEILENLQKQNQLQQEIVEEQKKILGELKELKQIALEETIKESQQKQQDTAEAVQTKHKEVEKPSKNNKSEIGIIQELSQIKDVVVNNDMIIKDLEHIKSNEKGANQEILNNNKLVVANEIVQNYIPHQNENKRDVNLPIQEDATPDVQNRIQNIVEPTIQIPIRNIPEVIAKKTIEDTVLKLLEKQMEENNRSEQSKSEKKINSIVENKVQNITKTKENVEVKESDPDIVNSMRRDILSADELIRVKRDIDDQENALEKKSINIELDSIQKQCSHSSDSDIIVGKDDETRYGGKFLARELKSVKSAIDNNP